MASVENISPLVCGVCLENKEGRTPKVLPCLHSFCQDCLKEWNTTRIVQAFGGRGWIECPLCRKRANIPVGGISAFPLDFNVKQFSDYIKAKSNRLSCQKCAIFDLSQTATAVCKTCNRLFCDKCSVEHSKMPLFIYHKIVHTFCKVHGASLDYVCVTCFMGLCVDCVHSDAHKEHEITNVVTGLSRAKTKFGHMNSDLKDKITDYNKEIDSKLQLCLKKQCESENNIRRAGELIKGKVDQILETAVEKHQEEHSAVLKENFVLKGVEREWNGAFVSEIDDLFQGKTEEILQNLQKSSDSIHESLDSIKEAHGAIPNPDLLSTDCCRLDGFEKVVEELEKCTLVCGLSSALSRTQNAPVLKFVRKVQCGTGSGLNTPWNGNITATGDLVVCNWGGGAVHRVLRDGSIETLSDTYDFSASCCHRENVYVICSSGRELVKFLPGCSSHILELDLSVPWSRGIATDGNYIFISNETEIVRYSLSEHTCESIINQNWPNSITSMRIQDSMVVVVADRERHQLVFYDQSGKEMRRFGKHGTGNGELNHPCGVKRTVNGNIYIADWENNRIVEYKHDGTFVRNVLTKDDGLQYPCDIALSFPYLWVLECVNQNGTDIASVKLFQFV